MSHWYVAAWGETKLDEFGDWWRDLSTGQQASLSACIELLEFHPTQTRKHGIAVRGTPPTPVRLV